MTGAGSSVISNGIYNLKCVSVPEFSGSGIGGLYLSGLEEAIVVSMGTGTAINHAKRISKNKYEIKYLGGTGIGGGTLVGLSRKMLGLDTVEHIEQLALSGNLDNVDLRIKDISHNHNYHGINENLTAANFGKVSDIATSGDIALGIINMVFETIGMIGMFASRNVGTKNIVLTGNMTSLPQAKEIFGNLNTLFDLNFIIPENAVFATAHGAALLK